jgi:hypothetical protein
VTSPSSRPRTTNHSVGAGRPTGCDVSVRRHRSGAVQAVDQTMETWQTGRAKQRSTVLMPRIRQLKDTLARSFLTHKQTGCPG